MDLVPSSNAVLALSRMLTSGIGSIATLLNRLPRVLTVKRNLTRKDVNMATSSTNRKFHPEKLLEIEYSNGVKHTKLSLTVSYD